MSKGYGRTQRALIAIFEAHPGKLFGIDDLVAAIYEEQPVTQVHRDYINAAMRKLAPIIEVKRYRSGRPKRRGWSWCFRA
jgi:hypothetical protein